MGNAALQTRSVFFSYDLNEEDLSSVRASEVIWTAQDLLVVQSGRNAQGEFEVVKPHRRKDTHCIVMNADLLKLLFRQLSINMDISRVASVRVQPLYSDSAIPAEISAQQ